MQKIRPIALLILAMLSIQFGSSVAKKLFPIAGVAGASTLRLLVAALALGLLFRPWREKVPRDSQRDLLFYGGSLGLMNLAFYFALERIPLGIAVALEFTGPLAVAIYNGKRKLDYLWATLAGGGIFLLAPSFESSTSIDLLGAGLALVAGGFWGSYIIYGKRLSGKVKTKVAASSGMIIAALIVLPWGLFLDFSSMFAKEAIPMGVFVGLFSSAIPYSLEMSSLRKLSSQTFSVLMSLEPAIASLMGLLFLNETLSPKQIAAIICVVIASQGSSLTPRRPIPGL